jgi:glycerophosphoryl diester phosphodiesterase
MRAFLLLFLLCTGCMMPPDTTTLDRALGDKHKGLPAYRCTRGAHRGDSGVYVENSPRAIRAAQQNPRYGFIEFDVQYSADKKPVVFHDGNLLRVFGSRKKLKSSTLSDLQDLAGEDIASYERIMNLAQGKPVNIEIKSQGDDAEDRQLTDWIVADIRKRGIENEVMISSISDEVIAYVHETYPDIPTGQIYFVNPSTFLPFDFLTEALYKSPADYIMLYTANLQNIDDLIALKPKNKTLVFWAFDDTMYIVHKDLSDRLWSEGAVKNFWDSLRCKIVWRRSAQ